MTDEDLGRRRAGKLGNERLKLIAAFCNTMGVATFITSAVAPTANGRDVSVVQIVSGAALAFVLHCAGQAVLWLWRSED